MKTLKMTKAACPVAALADEAQCAIDAWDAVEDASENDESMENYIPSVSNFLYATIDRASCERATSAKGALFQIATASHFLDALEGDALNHKSDKISLRAKAVRRMLLSVASYIESTGDARVEDACGAYFFTPSEREDIAAARALAD